jgi:perosamine synthetase
VIVQSFTNMASVFAVLYTGATPVPIDSEPRTLNMDPALLETKITSRTKAILPVHIYGHPVDMDPVMEIARKHKLYVIEDCAEAHGALYKGKKVGSIGDIGCFSMYVNKIVQTGEGGMLTMKDSVLADRARSLKCLAFGKENKFMHQAVGFNYRMTNMQCALGVSQMKKVDAIVEKKRELAKRYNELLADIPEFQLPIEEPYAKNVYWMYNIVLRDSLEGKRSALLSALKEKGVEAREDFIPFSSQEIFIKQGLVKGTEDPVADYAGNNGFYLPSGPAINNEEIQYVSECVHEAVASLRA